MLTKLLFPPDCHAAVDCLTGQREEKEPGSLQWNELHCEWSGLQ